FPDRTSPTAMRCSAVFTTVDKARSIGRVTRCFVHVRPSDDVHAMPTGFKQKVPLLQCSPTATNPWASAARSRTASPRAKCRLEASQFNVGNVLPGEGDGLLGAATTVGEGSAACD